MSTLDDRIRALAPVPETLPSVDRIRFRAARRQANRRTGAISVVAVLVVAVVVVALAGRSTDEGATVTAEPTTVPQATQIAFGGATGVTLTVTPPTGLVDGQSVEVRVDGLERLPGAQLAMCRGDLQEPVGLEDCDLGALGQVGAAAASQTVVVSATLTFAAGGERYDCAAEPAGCVIAVGTTGPRVHGVAVPVEFAPGSASPVGQAALTVPLTADLSAGDLVPVSASGLLPNRSYRLIQCAPTVDDPAVCVGDAEVGPRDVVADPQGTIGTVHAVSPVVWSTWDGAVDCTLTECRLQLLDASWAAVATSAPLRFAGGVVAELPRLVLEPAGPYVHGQEVGVQGSGFPPGTTVGGRLGQCPAGLDTRKEERCTHGTGFGTVVSGDGTFVVSLTVRDALPFTGSCRVAPGCVIAWVIDHGPTVADVPLTFR